jgi:hypothetical protein
VFDLVGALRVFDAIKRAAPRQVVRQPSDFVWGLWPSVNTTSDISICFDGSAATPATMNPLEPVSTGCCAPVIFLPSSSFIAGIIGAAPGSGTSGPRLSVRRGSEIGGPSAVAWGPMSLGLMSKLP